MAKKARRARAKCVWDGPYSDSPNGGITQSLLQKFMVCRHRFWLQAVMGYDPEPTYSHKMEFGSIFHAGVEQLEAWDSLTTGLKLKNADRGMRAYCERLKEQFPADHSQISKDRLLAFPHLELWMKHWAREPLQVVEREHVCGYWHCLADGREIWVKGKVDGIVKDGRSLMMHEIKTKGLIDELQIKQSLKWDLQIHVYANYCLAAGYPIKGVLYDVIRRPLGSRSSPQIRKGEDWMAYLKRLFRTYEGSVEGYPIADHPEHWFMRWRREITEKHLDQFNQRILDPWLTQLADWWDSISSSPERPWESPIHFMRPFGVWDSINNGFKGDFFDQIAMGLEPPRQRFLFPELE